MPHALPIASPGLQALILCGPGHSLETFTSNPEETPKALLPVANRPMVWYPLDWCYRMGITNIHLVSTEASGKALDVALSQNPHLTSLPLPRATVLTPSGNTQTSGTADLLRSPEVQAIIKGDFLVLPCDLVSEIPGEHFLESWMINQPRRCTSTTPITEARASSMYDPSHQLERLGGLSVWYETRGGTSKGEETDFLITTPLTNASRLEAREDPQRQLSMLAYSTTTATLKDIMADEESLPIRHGILRKYRRIRTFRTYRDAHIYIFPRWILDVVSSNIDMDSISEDLAGSWAKAGWQEGLAGKLGFHTITEPGGQHSPQHSPTTIVDSEMVDTTRGDIVGEDRLNTSSSRPQETRGSGTSTSVPPILAYTCSPGSMGPLLRRTDTAVLILQVSLHLARIEATEDSVQDTTSPLAHSRKISNPAGIAAKCTITKNDCLLADNVTVEERCVIKESVIGANCHVKSGARLTRCVLMDGVIIGERCQLTGCVLGRRSQIGRECTLKECEVQDGNHVPEKTDSKGEKFTFFEALDGSVGLDSEDSVSHDTAASND